MCWPSSHLPPLTCHPSAGVDKLLTSLFTSLIHSFNTFQADSLVWKLTCQHFALPIQGHWVEKEGKCWLQRSRRRKNDSFLAILLLLVAFPGMHCSKNLGQPARSQNMFLCFVTAWDHMASTSHPVPFRVVRSQYSGTKYKRLGKAGIHNWAHTKQSTGAFCSGFWGWAIKLYSFPVSPGFPSLWTQIRLFSYNLQLQDSLSRNPQRCWYFLCFAKSLGLCLHRLMPSISSLPTGHLGQLTVALYFSGTADLPLANADTSMWPSALS